MVRGLLCRLKWIHSDPDSKLAGSGQNKLSQFCLPVNLCELWLQIIGTEGGSGMVCLFFFFLVSTVDKKIGLSSWKEDCDLLNLSQLNLLRLSFIILCLPALSLFSLASKYPTYSILTPYLLHLCQRESKESFLVGGH